MDASQVGDAIVSLVQATQEEAKAREGYDGGSWGWHGNIFIEARQQAEQRVYDAITALVDARIAAALEAKEPKP